MSDTHAGPTHADAAAAGPVSPADHAAQPHVVPMAGLKFEKIELQEFLDADRGAGQHIGILLAFLFCVLFVLMSGATLWTYIHQNQSHDPHALPAATDHGGH